MRGRERSGGDEGKTSGANGDAKAAMRGYERVNHLVCTMVCNTWYILVNDRHILMEMDCSASFILESMYQVPQRFLGLICMARVFCIVSL